MARTRNQAGRSDAGPSRRQPSHLPTPQDGESRGDRPQHSLHSVHSGQSVRHHHSQPQPDLRESLNRSRAHITMGSREVNAIEGARREAENARRQTRLYDMEVLRLQHEETGRKLQEMATEIAQDRRHRYADPHHDHPPAHSVESSTQGGRSRRRSLTPEDEGRSRRRRRTSPLPQREKRHEHRRSGQGSVFSRLQRVSDPQPHTAGHRPDSAGALNVQTEPRTW